MRDFRSTWLRLHPQLVPLGRRACYSDIIENGTTIRFHVLPESRERIKASEETELMLSRYDALARENLPASQPVWMFAAEHKDPDGHPDHRPVDILPLAESEIDKTPADIASLAKYLCIRKQRLQNLCHEFGLKFEWELYDPGDELIYAIHAAPVIWSLSTFRKLLLSIHRGQVWDIAWLNPVNGAIFAPYYAGVDLRLPTTGDVDILVAKYVDWLPQN